MADGKMASILSFMIDFPFYHSSCDIFGGTIELLHEIDYGSIYYRQAEIFLFGNISTKVLLIL
jgi:hypothetical protein